MCNTLKVCLDMVIVVEWDVKSCQQIPGLAKSPYQMYLWEVCCVNVSSENVLTPVSHFTSVFSCLFHVSVKMQVLQMFDTC